MPDIFTFKQFDVDQNACAMKINTDGVLLGALIQANNPKAVLDIGTGTGVIAMMLAQRFNNAQIEAVEIDETAAETANKNFINSSFASRLKVHPINFESFFCKFPGNKYDLIVSNPPFYINSLKSPGAKKKLAKHTDVYFFETLMDNVATHLTENGQCWLILPLETAQLVKGLAEQHQLYVNQIITLHSYKASDPHREILAFGLKKTIEQKMQFVIYEEQNKYSEQYQKALKDFFTIF